MTGLDRLNLNSVLPGVSPPSFFVSYPDTSVGF